MHERGVKTFSSKQLWAKFWNVNQLIWASGASVCFKSYWYIHLTINGSEVKLRKNTSLCIPGVVYRNTDETNVVRFISKNVLLFYKWNFSRSRIVFLVFFLGNPFKVGIFQSGGILHGKNLHGWGLWKEIFFLEGEEFSTDRSYLKFITFRDGIKKAYPFFSGSSSLEYEPLVLADSINCSAHKKSSAARQKFLKNIKGTVAKILDVLSRSSQV